MNDSNFSYVTSQRPRSLSSVISRVASERERQIQLFRELEDVKEDHQRTVEEVQTARDFSLSGLTCTLEDTLANTSDDERRMQLALKRFGSAYMVFLQETEAFCRSHRECQEEDVWRLQLATWRRERTNLLRGLYLQKTPPQHYSSIAAGQGLYNLWLDACRGASPENFLRTEMETLLRQERQIDWIVFNVSTSERNYYGSHCTIPSHHVNQFMSRVVCCLPNLRELCIMGLPSLRSDCIPWVDKLPSSLRKLIVRHSSFTVADLQAIHRTCSQLTTIGVTTSFCTDWGAASFLDDVYEREVEVKTALDNTVSWFD